MNILRPLLCSAILFTSVTTATTADEKGKWVSLFNGKDLTGWTPKIRHEKLGEDPKKTFRVEDGLLKVRYDHYDEFKDTFGHLFYHLPFTHYRFRVEYRFVGEQLKGGPGWAVRNSGIMVHGQNPATMAEDQDFPVSIEVQLLGGKGDGTKRTTGNLCTPGTHVFFDGKLVTAHCTNSNSETYDGERWVTAEIEVRGNEVIRHLIDGKNVLEYQKPVLDEGDESAKPLIKANGGEIALKGGTISLQSESHPCDFRNIEILVLDE